MSATDYNNHVIPESNDNVLMTGVSKSALRWVLASLSLILFATIIALSYSIGVEDAEKGSIPIIRADGNTVKVRPENPGGRQYPHQSLTLYNNFREDIPQKNVQLKEAPEKPIQLENTVPISEKERTNAIKAIAPTDNIKLTTVSEDQKIVEKPKPQPIIKKVTLTKKETSNLLLKKVSQNVAKKKQEKVASQQSSKGSFLQIGAFRSKADALSALKRAKSKFSEVASLGHMIVRANLGAKGTYYRLRVGPFKNKQASLNSCNRLKSRGQPCLYVYK